jgi:hypothetical protein
MSRHKYPTNELHTAVANAVLIVNTRHDVLYSDTWASQETLTTII